MTRWLAVLALAAATHGALAQPATVYGLIDVAVEHVGNVGAGRSGLDRMPSATVSLPSRIGFRGGEDHPGAIFAVTPLFKLDGEVFRLRSRGSDDGATLAAVRATYSLSKRSAIYATVGRIVNAGASALSVSAGAPGSSPVPGGAQNALAAGLRHSI